MHDVGAFLGEGAGDGQADAAGRAGDEGDFAFEHGEFSVEMPPRMMTRPAALRQARCRSGDNSAGQKFTRIPAIIAPWTQNRYIRPATDALARPTDCGRIALVLQGGGALGAYQAGVYQALHEAGLEPDWVSGVSIGAINAALIAGNPPRAAAGGAARILAPHHRPHHLAACARRRHLSARPATPIGA